MKSIFLTQVFIIILFSCTSQNNNQKKETYKNESESIISENLIELFWGSSNHFDSSNILETSVYYLNNSMYRKAVEILSHNYNLDTVKTGGFYGYKGGGNFEINPYKVYTFFRLNDYGENIIGNELLNELIKSAVKPEEELYTLQSIEATYLTIKNNISISEAETLIKQIKDLKKKLPYAKRLDFILANEYLKVNDNTNALKIFDKLIKDNYYALPSLRNLIRYLSVNKSSLLSKYVSISNDKFPFECNLVALNRSFKSAPDDSLYIKYNNCLKSSFQRDSVYAQVLLTKYYMRMGKIEKVDSITDKYLNDIDNKTYDSTVLYEKGNYFDLKMRVLFLKGNYKQLCEFTKSKLEFNPIISVDNKQELKFYIEKLYSEFISLDLKEFNTFFEKNFHNCYNK